MRNTDTLATQPRTTTDRSWLTVKEVAAELLVSPSLVYRAVARGDVPALRLSETGAIRIHRSVLDQ